MAETQTEIVTKLNQVTEQLGKVALESAASLDKVADLEAQLAAVGGVGGTVTQELSDAVNALVAQVKVVDDLVPDATA